MLILVEPIRVAVFWHLRVLRAVKGWLQGDLAAALAVSRETVNVIETGRYDLSLPLAFAIAKTFGLPIESIVRVDEG